ncbi:MAG TPA: hypothetical protein DG754_07740 [Bacteroidales bacterium]|nr:hypothetical protein [Bacteroidales bacterium]
MSFYYRAEDEDYPQDVDLLISLDGQPFQNLIELKGITNTDYAQNKINLSNYAGSIIQLQFLKTGTETYWGGLCIDDVSLYKLFDNNLVGLTVKGNQTPIVGNEVVYNISVENIGLLTQDTYTVKLMLEGGIELGTIPGISIANDEVKEFDIPWIPQAEHEGEIYIYGLVTAKCRKKRQSRQFAT